VAIATLKAGVVLARASGTPAGFVSIYSGLPDNNVHGLAASNGRLWVGLESGIARVDGLETARLFERRSDLGNSTPLMAVGPVGDPWIITSRGVIRVANGRMAPVISDEARLWDADRTGGFLWVGGFGGIWRCGPSGVDRVRYVSADVLQLATSASLPDGIVFLEGYRIKSLARSVHGGWAAHDVGAEVGDTPVSMLEDPAGDMWVSTMTRGIWRFSQVKSLDPDVPYRLTLKGYYSPGKGLPRVTRHPVLALAGGRMYALAEAGILALRADGTAFEPARAYADFVGLAATQSRGDAYWVVQRRGLQVPAVIRVSADEPFEPVEIPGLDQVGQVSNISATGNLLWIGGSKGMLRCRIGAAEVPDLATRLRASLADPRAPALSYSCPSAVVDDGITYETKLDAVNRDWSAPAGAAVRNLEGLAHGRYAFRVRAIDRWGREGPPAEVSFSIPAPWFETWPALALFAAAAAAIGTAGVRWRMARLRAQNERLNQLVAERTRELELSNSAKNEFLENISHEIRNPLNGLTGIIGLLKEERLEPRERDLARSLKAVAGTLTRVFEDVLGYSKLEYGYASTEKRPFALKPLLEEIVALFKVQADQFGCALALEWDGTFRDGFEGDPDKIRTIVGNFVGNALKYAPGAPVSVRVVGEDRPDGLVDLFIEVADGGPGVPDAEQAIIFNKFVRGSNAKDKQVAGTGLGLATCRALAQLMNGEVGLNNEPGKGATFFLGLLVARSEAGLDAGRAGVPARAEDPAPDGGRPAADAEAAPGGTALIVDDEEYNRTVLEGIALELGYAPEAASTAEEALRLVRERSHDVVFLDWELPDGKGDEVARAIRAGQASSNPIVLATTAHDSVEMRRRCREAGMDGFLLKPYDEARVRAMIATIHASRAGVGRADDVGFDGANGSLPARPGRSLDLKAFAHYSKARPGEAAEAARRYVGAIEREAADLGRAVASRDAAGVGRTAHRLRALGGLVGAAELCAAAGRLEVSRAAPGAEVREHLARNVLDACAELVGRLSGLACPNGEPEGLPSAAPRG
jgi:signal transduction histidine kinase/ActR/RegA family two-component response regulator